MNPHAYLERLENILYSRRDMETEEFRIQFRGLTVLFYATLRFQDTSKLQIFEELKPNARQKLQRFKFRYHYQSGDDHLLFRYDNSPHYPHLATFPSHKHVGNEVIAAEPPDLADVLKEIDTIIYARTDDQS